MEKFSTDNIQEAFEYVRQNFFPRWDRKREWKIVYDDSPLAYVLGGAECIRKCKTIYFYQPQVGNELLQRIIHEITHAFYLGHARNFRGIMFDKSIKAEELGLIELSDLLIFDAWSYEETIAPEHVYQHVKLRVQQHRKLSYWRIIEPMINSYGITIRDWEGLFPDCRRAYNEEKYHIYTPQTPWVG